MNEIAIERRGVLTEITLDRSEKANALSATLVEALAAAVDAARHDGTRLLVIRAAGRNFSAGFDFSAFEDASEGDLLWRFVRIEQLLQSVYHAPFATLAIAHGRNFGAGVDLFVACETRIAAPDATFRMPGLRFGVQLGTRRLARRIGEDAARAMLEETRTVGATEALALGLATHVSEPFKWDQLIADALQRATALSVEAAMRLRKATATDTRAADLADLVSSATVPGFKSRIETYRRSTSLNSSNA
jgi:enoyl-CoA hydratase